MNKKVPWKAVIIEDVCEMIVDCLNRTAPKVDHVTPYKMLRTTNIKDGRVDVQNVNYVTQEVFEKWTRRAVPQPNDVILTREAPLGDVGILREDSKGVFLGQRLVMYRTDPEKLDAKFLLYSLLSRDMQWQIQALGSGSTVEHMRVPDSKKLEIIIPSIEEQRAIGHILSSLDEKIEVNRRMNETLENTARAIFKSWFVDFDPVHAKANGEIPEGMSAETADLFPDDFQESELGLIPRGWRVGQIGNEVQAVGGSTPSTKNPDYWEDGHIYWTTPKDLSSLSSPVLLDTARKITGDGLKKISSGLLPIGTVLLSSRAPVGYLAIAEVSVAINQGYIAMICDKELSNYYTLFWCEANMHIIEGRSSGTTFREISKKNFRSIEVIVPSHAILDVFNKTVESLHEKVVCNLQENRTLTELRDTLLPRLISGELRVEDVSEFVGDV